MKITEQEYIAVHKLLKEILEAAQMTKTELSRLHPQESDRLPTEEKEVTKFIGDRIRLWRHTWIELPALEAMNILHKAYSRDD